MTSKITNSQEISIKDYYQCGKWSSTSGSEIWRCKKCYHGENGISKCLPLEIFVCSMLITKPRDIMARDHIWPYAHTWNYGSKFVNIIDGVFSPRFRLSKSGIAGGMPLRAKLYLTGLKS